MNPNDFFEGGGGGIQGHHHQSFCDPFTASMMKGQLHYPGQFLIPSYQEQQIPHHSQYFPMNIAEQSGAGPVPWSHSIPLCMPWYQQNSPFPPQNEMYDMNAQMPRRVIHCKRKGVHFDEAPSACKQYISEEVMAAKMGQLHISNTETNCTQQAFMDNSARQKATTLEELESRIFEDGSDIEFESTFCSASNNNNDEMDRLVVLSPELKKLEAEPIIPKSILEKIQKPSMELVLWKPPGGAIGQFIEATLTKKKDGEMEDPTDKSVTRNSPTSWQNNNSLSDRNLVVEEERSSEEMVC